MPRPKRPSRKDDAAYVMTIAQEARRAVRAGEQTPEEAQTSVEHALEAHLERAGRTLGHDEETGATLFCLPPTSGRYNLPCVS
jgi:topoisomerase IA-like protein